MGQLDKPESNLNETWIDMGRKLFESAYNTTKVVIDEIRYLPTNAQEVVPGYRGERINRAAQPGIHKVASGDTLDSVASRQLGPGASAKETQLYVSELRILNNLEDRAQLHSGQRLLLPGHTDDGGFVIKDAQGTIRTIWQDGTERIERINDTGFVRDTDATVKHWGPKPTDNYHQFELTDGSVVRKHKDALKVEAPHGVVMFEDEKGRGFKRTPSGVGYEEMHHGQQLKDNYVIFKVSDKQFAVKDSKTEYWIDRSTQNDLRVERSNLRHLAESKFADEEARAGFLSSMEKFEKRAESRLSHEEVARTYKEISRLLESKGNQPVSFANRLRLAEQVMRQAADPTSVDQGLHNTCNVASVEARIYTRTPSAAARLVSDVAITGKFETREKQTVTLDIGSLQPDEESRRQPPKAWDRCFAGQLFQVTAVNLHYASNNFINEDGFRPVPAIRVRYEQRPITTEKDDTGERLINAATKAEILNKEGKPFREPHLYGWQLKSLHNQIAGKDEDTFILQHESYGEPKGHALTFSTKEQMQDRILEMKRQGKLPALIMVHTGNEPFHTDSIDGTAGGSGEEHVVNITDIDEKSGIVSIDNQWGKHRDHLGKSGISVHDLFLATRKSDEKETIQAMEMDVEWNRKNNKIDGYKELELLRLKWYAGEIGDWRFHRAVVRVMRESQQRWDQQVFNANSESGRERLRTLAKYKQLIRDMQDESPKRAKAMRKVLEHS